MSASSTPSKAVGYLQHFPKYFLVPYGSPKTLTDEMFKKRLSASNCELFLKPKTFFSEMAETIICNADVLRDEWFNTEIGDKILKRCHQFHLNLSKMNTKESTEEVMEEDVTMLLNAIYNEKLNQIHDQLYEMGQKMFLMGIYFKACRYVLSNPEFFARNSNLVSRNDVEFQKNPTMEEMETMLIRECKSQQVQHPTTCSKRNLKAALESTDDEQSDSKMKKNKKDKKNPLKSTELS